MKKLLTPVAILLSVAAIIALASMLNWRCNNNSETELVIINPAFAKYISAYTSGVISKKSTIKLQLVAPATKPGKAGDQVNTKLLSFSPSLDGNAFWLDDKTIEFKPEEDLEPGTLYKASFHLGKLLEVDEDFEHFEFNFQAIKPGFEFEQVGLTAVDKDKMQYTAVIRTADVEKEKDVEAMLQINYPEQNLKAVWTHNHANKTHELVIRGIHRGSRGQSLKLTVDGDPIDVKRVLDQERTVPAVGDFTLLDAVAKNEGEQYVLLQFSDIISKTQQLDGLIRLVTEGTVLVVDDANEDVSEASNTMVADTAMAVTSTAADTTSVVPINNVAAQQQNDNNLTYTITGSEIKIYSAKRLQGNYNLQVSAALVNEWNQRLGEEKKATVSFESNWPSVKIFGTGAILPSSGGKLLLPFDAVNLKAVDIFIIKIYENNVGQFLQRNSYDGESELRMVATPLAQSAVKLDEDGSINLHRKNRFSIDVDKYIKAEPGAIYRVFIGFRPEYSLYNCSKETVETDEDEEDYYYREEGNDVLDDSEENFWRRYEDYYPYGYSWSNRDNPCHKSYYNKERFASRNIIASNIGLTAKKASDNSLFVIASNIVTTVPMNGVDLKVYDYQNQVLNTASTNGEGWAKLDVKGKPYLLVASSGNEKGYLRLDDGSSLLLSRFDVGGSEVRQGIKAFLFGERGVWRPGDSLFLGCMIEDKQKALPKSHPVEVSLVNPKGILYKKLVVSNSDDGFNVFRLATDADAPTGNWSYKVKIGNSVFEKTLKIETVMPNRLKINLDTGPEGYLAGGDESSFRLSAKWLFGATAQNLKARIDAQIYKRTTTFTGFNGFVFDNPIADFATQSKTIFDGSLNSSGSTEFKPSLDIPGDVPGVLLANMVVKVFEPGGSFSIDNVSLPYHKFRSYVGIKLPEGNATWGYLPLNKPQKFDVVNVDRQGKPITSGGTATVKLYKMQWRWWWDNTSEQVSNFTEDRYNKLVETTQVNLSNGRGSVEFNFTSERWGRYMILVTDDKSGHTTGKVFYVDDDSWQSRVDNTDASAASMLSFKTDKEKYQVGEVVKLSIPSAKGGQALVSIESGSKVLKTYLLKTEKGQTKFSFEASKEMAPNVYINISLIQPHAQTVNDLPIRLYGVVPVMVEDKNTVLHPVIKMDDVIKPETKTTLQVSEHNGKEMSYVIAIVDEGLLDLTRFKTPNPHATFYAREALGVKSYDLYDQVIGAWGMELQRILTVGGDAEGDLASKTRRANRFKPVVQFMGPFKSNGGSNSHNFILPPYMGSVRVMVIAGGNGAYGHAEKAIAVKKPMMLLSTLPRVLAPGEEFSIPVTVFATNNSIKNVQLKLESNGFVQGTGNVQLNFTGSGEQQVYFTAKSGSHTGVGKVRIIATSGRESSFNDTEIEIRNPNPYVTKTSEFILAPGQTLNTTIDKIGDAASSKATVEISSIPAINLEKRLGFLIQYPYGCVEQTVSSVFPQLFVHQLVELNAEKKTVIDRHIKAAIQKLNNFQNPDGGMAYWPGSPHSDPWGTSYAAHFLTLAASRGYNVSTAMLQQVRMFMRTEANRWNVVRPPMYGEDLDQAYRLYLLALAKQPETGAMNRLRTYRFLSIEAKWRLAAAYHLIGNSQVALQLISGLPTTFNKRDYWGVSYGSELRDEAMVLETLTLMNRKAEAGKMVRDIAARLGSDKWYSTQTTAYCLLAISQFTGSSGNDIKLNVSVTTGTALNVNTTSTMYQQAVSFSGSRGKVSLQNKGKNTIFVKLVNQGKPAVVETTSYPTSSLIKTTVVFINNNAQPINIDALKAGTDFLARVTVKNTGKRGTFTQMALSQLFPSGWEISNTRLFNSEGAFQSSPVEYMDIRDDRVNHFFDIRQGETLTFYVQLTAAYAGRFFWPGVYCEAMYNSEISSGVNGRWINVVR